MQNAQHDLYQLQALLLLKIIKTDFRFCIQYCSCLPSLILLFYDLTLHFFSLVNSLQLNFELLPRSATTTWKTRRDRTYIHSSSYLLLSSTLLRYDFLETSWEIMVSPEKWSEVDRVWSVNEKPKQYHEFCPCHKQKMLVSLIIYWGSGSCQRIATFNNSRGLNYCIPRDS